MADCMEFPKDWKKFLEDYSFRDHKEFYTNGARLIPTFRVEQMMQHYLQKATEDSVPRGVTIQQWIPVTERLPQEDKPMDLVNDLVQVLLKSGAVTVGFYQRQQKTWYVTPECMSYYAIATEEEEVRAWRPLAEPQKGE